MPRRVNRRTDAEYLLFVAQYWHRSPPDLADPETERRGNREQVAVVVAPAHELASSREARSA